MNQVIDYHVSSSYQSNPPLSEEMLPPGEWMCHRCNVRKKVSGRSSTTHSILHQWYCHAAVNMWKKVIDCM